MGKKIFSSCRWKTKILEILFLSIWIILFLALLFLGQEWSVFCFFLLYFVYHEHFFSLSTYQVKNSYLNQIGKHFLFITLTLSNNKLFYPIHGTEGKYSIQNKYTMYKVKIVFFFLQLHLILFTRELNCSPESTFWILTPYVASSYIFVRYEHYRHWIIVLNKYFQDK